MHEAIYYTIHMWNVIAIHQESILLTFAELAKAKKWLIIKNWGVSHHSATVLATQQLILLLPLYCFFLVMDLSLWFWSWAWPFLEGLGSIFWEGPSLNLGSGLTFLWRAQKVWAFLLKCYSLLIQRAQLITIFSYLPMQKAPFIDAASSYRIKKHYTELFLIQFFCIRQNCDV